MAGGPNEMREVRVRSREVGVRITSREVGVRGIMRGGGENHVARGGGERDHARGAALRLGQKAMVPTLLFEVGLVDARKAACNDDDAAKVPAYASARVRRPINHAESAFQWHT